MQALNSNDVPGQDVLNAALPLFDRNLQQQSDVLRQSGPRFADQTERNVGRSSERSIQDFNLFAQQTLEQGRQRELQQLIAAGAFGAGQEQMNLNAILPLLQTGLTAGGATSAPVIEQNPGTFSQITSALGTLGGIGLAATGPFGPLAGAAAGTVGGMSGSVGGVQTGTGGVNQLPPGVLQFLQSGGFG